ncbi:hypothetical protein BT63DRAFT_196740 [Microthyrium microscopicum]|uniref:RRN6 beta-propeller domain-containing protein n=1 Tax=Microthyrium microscopicum TaxID=703497 RepID=A0A6A6UJT0_9PEZI|nr:hypothetical protein BT63DRAFT_196740 [Microthyrium microscopicum]
MADFALRSQGYGRFGSSTYDTDERAWNTARAYHKRDDYRILSHLENIILAQPESTSAGSQYVPVTDATAFSRIAADAFPHLHNPAPGLGVDLISSWMVTQSLNEYDPAVGDLIVFGQFRPTIKFLPFLITPAGVHGDSVQFSGMRYQSTWFRLRPSIRCRLLQFTPRSGIWKGPGAPIRQIAISAPITQGSKQRTRYMALRLPAKTLVFFLWYNELQVPIKMPIHGGIESLHRIEQEIAMEIKIKDSSVQHADVAFNPWFDRQVVLIDAAGHWAVFVIPQKPKKLSFSRIPKPTYQGDFMFYPEQMPREPEDDRLNEPVANNEVIEDGWARVAWVINEATLLLCSRTHLQCIHLKSMARFPFSGFKATEPAMNLDVRMVGPKRDQVFVLTTSRIFWLQLEAKEDFAIGKVIIRFNETINTRHFRDQNDLSLRMKILDFQDGKRLITPNRSIC